MLRYQGGLTISRTAAGAIEPYRILKFAAGDNVAQAAAAGDALCGVSGQLGAAAGERISVEKSGLVPITYGGAVTAGDLLTANADGKAIKAVAGAAVLFVIGVAQEDGAADEIGSLLILPGQLPALA